MNGTRLTEILYPRALIGGKRHEGEGEDEDELVQRVAGACRRTERAGGGVSYASPHSQGGEADQPCNSPGEYQLFLTSPTSNTRADTMVHAGGNYPATRTPPHDHLRPRGLGICWLLSAVPDVEEIPPAYHA